MFLGKICVSMASLRKDTPRAIDGPDMAPIKADTSEPATLRSYKTGIAAESIFCGPNRARARLAAEKTAK